MLSLGIELQRHVRVSDTFPTCSDVHSAFNYTQHLENIIPELGPFFDKMTTVHQPLTAQEALAEFRQIQSRLTPSQLSQEVTTRWWRKGKPYLTALIHSLFIRLGIVITKEESR
jgi:hypothetical protein